MSIVTAIFQALFQALCIILPISENAHSSVFHDFSSRFGGGSSALTGIIHIAVAVGITVAMYKLFLRMFNEFFFTVKDVIHKETKANSQKPARQFMYNSLISLVPLLLWLIPCGSKGFLFDVLRSTQYNKTLLDEGIFMVVTGGLLFAAVRVLTIKTNNKELTQLPAVVVGIAALLCVPLSGLSFVGVAFSILLIFGVKTKQALNYTLYLSVPLLLVCGIIELCTAVSVMTVVQAIIGVVIAIVASFVLVRVLRYLVKNNLLKFFAWYDVSFGAVVLVVGIFELIFR